jgi:subtilase family serine protease
MNMFAFHLRRCIRRFSPASRASGGGSSRARHAARRSWWPGLEFLEERVTPTGGITITDAFVVNASDQPLTVVNAGQRISIQADFTTEDLPAGASYAFDYDVNGLTRQSSYVNLGAGLSGTNSYYDYWGSFVASPGTNQVTVTVAPQQTAHSTSAGYNTNTMSFSFNALLPAVGSLSYTVSQIRAAYGINSIPNFGTATADGSGQTIAVVDAFNDPSIITDLDGFDESMNLTTNSSPTLYQQYGPASSFLTVYNQSGTNITSEIGNSGVGAVPPVDPTGFWELEETIDVEWAHAIAPGAKIDVIECDGTGSFLGLFGGAATAAQLPGVTVVSMSWIWFESNWSGSNGSGELAYDSSTFVTPSGHPGITFLAATGDGGTPGGYPAFSPNVLAVGASQLTMNGDTYGSETAWSFPTPRTLDHGSGSYSQTGPWTSQSGGFSGSYSTAAAGSNSSATWTTSLSSPDYGWLGGTEVSATWVASPGNATNATYSIYDGTATTGTLLGTVTVNQTKAPIGTSDGNTQFQELGDYYSQTGTLTVVLNANSTNGTVVADAVGIAPAWATAGGQSQYEAEPSYQLGVQSTGYRTTPEVLFNGSDNSGVYCFQNGEIGFDYFGTSLATPCWAGLFAIADQGRVAADEPTFNSTANPQQAQQALYSLPASDFRQITTGYNGLSPGPGYNEITGLGSPIANLVVPALVSYGVGTQLVITAQPPASVTAGSTFGLTVAVLDQYGNLETDDYTTQVTVSLRVGTGPLLGTTTVTVTAGVATFTDLSVARAETIILIVTAPAVIHADSDPVTVNPAADTRLSITAPPTATPGTPFTSTVTAFDAYNNVATGLLGTVSFTSSGSGASFPSVCTFTNGDGGVNTFGDAVTLRKSATQTSTAYDVV